MYKKLQISLVIYISVDVIFRLWAAIFLIDTPWVADTMEHFSQLFLVFIVGYSFGMRPFNPFYYRIQSEGTGSNPQSSNQGDNDGDENFESPDRFNLATLLYRPATLHRNTPAPSSSSSSQRGQMRTNLLSDGSSSMLPLSDEEDLTPPDDPWQYRSSVWQPGVPVPKLPSDFACWLFGPSASDESDVRIVRTPNSTSTHSKLFVAEPLTTLKKGASKSGSLPSFKPPRHIAVAIRQEETEFKEIVGGRGAAIPLQPMGRPAPLSTSNQHQPASLNTPGVSMSPLLRSAGYD